MNRKREIAIDTIKRAPFAIVAYSGGVDSSLVLSLAVEHLGKDRVLGVMIQTFFQEEKDIARGVGQGVEAGFPIKIVHSSPPEELRFNPKDRCYHCKSSILTTLKNLLPQEGGMIFDGTNGDDLLEDRPGLKALKEHGIISPLGEAGLSKKEIRLWAKERGLAAWNQPSGSCSATRLPVGEEITEKKLEDIRRMEEDLLSLGVEQVRVRPNGWEVTVELSGKDLNHPRLKGEIEQYFLKSSFKKFYLKERNWT